MEAHLSPDVRVFPDGDLMAREAADIFIAGCNLASAHGRGFSVAISGGSTPMPFFRLLASDEYSSQIDWGRVHIFWVDERSVPPTHPDSNFGAAVAALIYNVPIPVDNIHRIYGELEPDVAASRYEDDLRGHFGAAGVPVFDMVFLGMGADGHTASLFPGSDALSERKRLAQAVYVEKLDSHRVTLTLPVINASSEVVFVVAGKDKAGTLRAVLDGPASTGRPASMVRPADGRLVWLVDKEAAG